jgi:hypothetical protein
MTDWPQIRIAVDDWRNARTDEVEHCQHCREAVLEGELERHLGEMRCEDCRPLCPVCRDVPAWEANEFCTDCALWAMGVEV